MDIMGKTFDFLGDSITEGVGASGYDFSYVTVFGRKYGANVNNYGVGGSRIARQQDEHSPYGHINDDFCRRFETMADADFVGIFGGVNDYGHGDAPIGQIDDRTPDTFYGACHYLFRGVLEKYAGKQVFVMTPIHKLNEYAPSQAGKPLKAYVDIIKEVACYWSIPVLDLYAISGINPEIPIHKEMFMPDGLHPSDRGHEIIADKIASFIRIL